MKSSIYVTACVTILSCAALPSNAAEGIGTAKTVVQNVSGELARVQRNLTPGDQVFQDEVVRTAPRASTSLVFEDRTTLSLGSNSEVKLDQFVYSRRGGTSSILFDASRGALRFVTGSATKSAYRVKTPTATIGVRGTDFDVYVARFFTTMVLLRSGGLRVCRKQVSNIWLDSPHCRDLDRARTYVVVTSGGISGPFAWNGQNPGDILNGNRPGPGAQGDNNETDSQQQISPAPQRSSPSGGGGPVID